MASVFQSLLSCVAISGGDGCLCCVEVLLQGEAFREDLAEAQPKARVRTLQKEASKEASRLKLQLSDLIAQVSLSRARQELNSLWKKSDGWI